jgi:hypothetical protein
MPYPALPDRRMPYHRDGTRLGINVESNTDRSVPNFGVGFSYWATQAQLAELNDYDASDTGIGNSVSGYYVSNEKSHVMFWWFFPEQREVTALVVGEGSRAEGDGLVSGQSQIQGSNDTTNGLDGTWETGSMPSGLGIAYLRVRTDDWRTNIKPVSFTGPKRVVRLGVKVITLAFQNVGNIVLIHLYGEKASGQTPDDILFIDDITDLEFQAPLDFGDRPLGTTVTRVFRLKNASPSKTANSINLQCNDSDFAISSDGTTWVTTLNFASLAPGAETSNLYVRCTTPNPGAQLGPRFAEMVVTVGSWT